MSKALLEAVKLSHAFDYPLYHDVNIILQAGESMAVVGRSGSGKSTLLHTLSTFLEPDSGSVALCGKDVYTLKEEALEQLRREEVGIVFQAHYLFKGMTGRENIEIATMLSGEEIDPQLLKELEIEDVVDQKIGDLSGGQQQRVSIARVLSKKPKVIFADEPTGNLDKQTAMLVMTVLFGYIAKTGAALFLVTHDDEIASRCDRQYRLETQTLSMNFP